MGQPKGYPETAGDRCFACSRGLSTADMAVYLYGAWFHLPCYQRENNFPIQERSVPRATAWSSPAGPVPRLMAWIDRPRRAPSITHADAVELGRRGGLKGGKA